MTRSVPRRTNIHTIRVLVRRGKGETVPPFTSGPVALLPRPCTNVRWARSEHSCLNHGVERIAHIAHGFAEAQQWDSDLYRSLTPEERQRIAKILRERYYGKRRPDVRDRVAGLRRPGGKRDG